MLPVAREFFTVDLRGLRGALSARAAARNLTESDVLRSAVAAALQGDPSLATLAALRAGDDRPPHHQLKLSVRLSRLCADRLDRDARTAGLSRGAYLERLIDGTPPVTAAADRAAGAAALNASAAELAVLSRDIHRLTQLLRAGAVEPARAYRERLGSLDRDVRAHLDLAAATLAEFSADWIGDGRTSTLAIHRRAMA
jgi:hypothetical protein